MTLNKNQQALLLAVIRGYKVTEDGVTVSPYGRDVGGVSYYGAYKIPYWVFGLNMDNIYSCKVHSHRLMAYQKYGSVIFENNIQVRHLDTNSLNNSWSNIEIGSPAENSLDRSEDRRIASVYNASQRNRKWSDIDVKSMIRDRDHGMTYRDIMKKYNISTGGLHNILYKAKYINKIISR